jgi:hypothetical protein
MMKLVLCLTIAAVAASNLRTEPLVAKHAIEPNDPRDPDMKGTHVTGQFCLQMLKDIQTMVAPVSCPPAPTPTPPPPPRARAPPPVCPPPRARALTRKAATRGGENGGDKRD